MHSLALFLLLTSQLVLSASQHGTVTHYTVEIALCFVMDGKSECKSGYQPFTFNRTPLAPDDADEAQLLARGLRARMVAGGRFPSPPPRSASPAAKRRQV